MNLLTRLLTMVRNLVKVLVDDDGVIVTPRRLDRAAPTAVQPPVETYQGAASALTDWQAVTSLHYVKNVVKASRDRAHPDIIGFYVALNKELKRRGYPFYAFEFFRNEADQNEANHLGNSKAGWGASPHNFGYAVDIIHLSRSWDLSKKEWDLIGVIGKEVARKKHLKMVWGGDWDFWDPAHWELKDWRVARLSVALLRDEGIDPDSPHENRWALLDARTKKYIADMRRFA